MVALAARPAASLAARTRRVLELTTQCNEAAKIGGRNEIFKPTTHMLKAFNSVAWISARDERSLGTFIDCLFFIY